MDSILHMLNIGSSALTTLARAGTGVSAQPAAEKPAALLKLYEFEACPYCRLVREVLTELDIDALVYPCPTGGERYRPKLAALGGKTQFPFLLDPNTDRTLYESLEIIGYLYGTYAQRPLSLKWRAGALQKLGSQLAGTTRGLAGSRARPSRAPDLPLELFSFESSPFARPVRELLCELEIPYILRSAGRSRLGDWVPPIVRDALNTESDPALENRRDLLARAGRVSIPYLVDPNTNAEMAESADILEYLRRNYAA